MTPNSLQANIDELMYKVQFQEPLLGSNRFYHMYKVINSVRLKEVELDK